MHSVVAQFAGKREVIASETVPCVAGRGCCLGRIVHKSQLPKLFTNRKYKFFCTFYMFYTAKRQSCRTLLPPRRLPGALPRLRGHHPSGRTRQGVRAFGAGSALCAMGRARRRKVVRLLDRHDRREAWDVPADGAQPLELADAVAVERAGRSGAEGSPRREQERLCRHGVPCGRSGTDVARACLARARREGRRMGERRGPRHERQGSCAFARQTGRRRGSLGKILFDRINKIDRIESR